MYDLRLVGTQKRFPDLVDTEDVEGVYFRNFRKVLLESKEELKLTDAMWVDVNLPSSSGRETASAKKKVQATGRDQARVRYKAVAKKLVEPDFLCEEVWNKDIMAILEDVYDKEFRLTKVNEHFGEWEGKEWMEAMDRYHAALAQRLPIEWKRRLATLGDHKKNAMKRLALQQAPEKLAWLRMLHRTGGREIPCPFLCRMFVEDFTRYLSSAEGGFKLVSRFLCVR